MINTITTHAARFAPSSLTPVVPQLLFCVCSFQGQAHALPWSPTMASNGQPTVVIDDTNVHYNTSRDAAQAAAPSAPLSDSITGAQKSPWNNTLVVITTPTSFWYNVTGQ